MVGDKPNKDPLGSYFHLGSSNKEKISNNNDNNNNNNSNNDNEKNNDSKSYFKQYC